jgi:hypothetical protein
LALQAKGEFGGSQVGIQNNNGRHGFWDAIATIHHGATNGK